MQHAALSHIPGDLGWPWIGHTFRAARDPVGLARERFAQYGPIYKSRTIFATAVALLGPDAAQTVLLDKAHIFSSKEGWRPNLGRLFPNALMLQDFDEHRVHRQIMLDAFKRSALSHYAGIMDRRFHARVQDWCQQGHLEVYPTLKAVLLDLGIDLFLGRDVALHVPWINQALSDMTAASTALLRWPLPGGQLWRGLRARQRVADLVRQSIPQARQDFRGTVLHRLCAARDEQGMYFSESQIVDHMLFIIMAAHDTTTSAATSVVLALAQHPAWQQRVRAEVRAKLPVNHVDARGARAADEVLAALADCTQLDAVYRESMRLHPPVPAIPRCTVQETTVGGISLPAHQHLWLLPIYNHRDPQWWHRPDDFIPERFMGEDSEDRQHKFLYLPFGAGPHTCIGLHVGAVMVKLLVARLLMQCEIGPPPMNLRRCFYPFPRPAAHCDLRLHAL